MRIRISDLPSLYDKMGPGSYITISWINVVGVPVSELNKGPCRQVDSSLLLHEDIGTFEFLGVGKKGGVPEVLLMRVATTVSWPKLIKDRKEGMDRLCKTTTRLVPDKRAPLIEKIFEEADKAGYQVDIHIEENSGVSDITKWPKNLRDGYLLAIRHAFKTPTLKAHPNGGELPSFATSARALADWSLRNVFFPAAGTIAKKPSAAGLRRLRRNKRKQVLSSNLPTEARAVSNYSWLNNNRDGIIGVLVGYNHSGESSWMVTARTLYNFIQDNGGSVFFLERPAEEVLSSSSIEQINDGSVALLLINTRTANIGPLFPGAHHYISRTLPSIVRVDAGSPNLVKSWWADYRARFDVVWINKNLNWLAEDWSWVDPSLPVEESPLRL